MYYFHFLDSFDKTNRSTIFLYIHKESILKIYANNKYTVTKQIKLATNCRRFDHSDIKKVSRQNVANDATNDINKDGKKSKNCPIAP